VISKNYEFYTYEAKYLDPDAVKIVIPAEIDEQTKVAIQKASIDAYKALCCEDFSRVDLFLTADGAVLVNEINTIPGFTNSSMFPVLWGNEGISYPALITKLIDLALERTNATERLETNFSEGEAHA
jgi:D-alanine-D-alanine ligase